MTALSLSDWPGRAVAVLYVGGCNLRCPGCHNASLAFTPQRHPEHDLAGVLALLAARKPWLDGVVVCGGEPTFDPGLPALIEALCGLGLPVKVDTNGALPQVVEALLGRFTHLTFGVDIKGPWEKYPLLTGGALSPEDAEARLGAVLALAQARPRSFLFRITLDPALTQDDVARVRACLPAGCELAEQPFVAPKRGQENTHAFTD